MDDFHNAILDYIGNHPGCGYRDLTNRFGVNQQTIRRHVLNSDEVQIKRPLINMPAKMYRVAKQDLGYIVELAEKVMNTPFYHRREGWTIRSLAKSLELPEPVFNSVIIHMEKEDMIQRVGETYITGRRYVLWRGPIEEGENWLCKPWRANSNQELGIWPNWRQWL